VIWIRFKALVWLMVILASSWVVGAERQTPLTISAVASDIQGPVGGLTSLHLQLQLKPGWHTFPAQVQKNAEGAGPAPIQVDVQAGSLIRPEGLAKASPVQRRWDDGFEMEVYRIEGAANLDVPLRLDSSLKPGRHETVLTVSYQACTEQRCRPLATVEVPCVIQVGPALSSSVGAAVHAPVTTTEREIQRRKREGFWAYLGFAMLAGALALLTPCVFPMVPITVSFFTARAQGKGGQALRDACLYGVGIVATFSALGLAVALIFGAAGIQTFAASPVVNLTIAVVFLVFAINLFGALEIRLPAFVLAWMGSRSGNGVAGVLLMGLTFTLTSFTCTVPFVGSALLSASRGEWFYPIVGMLGFSSVFALPFVLLALFPAALVRLPRAGAWMNRMKVVMGFMEVAAAIKFLSNADLALGSGLLPREVFLAIWSACALLILLYLLGSFRLMQDEPTERIGVVRTLAAMAFATLLFYLITGIQGRPMGELDSFLPPRVAVAEPHSTPASAPETQECGWRTDYAQALEEARRTGKPLFIDFTGYTCTNCRWMEQNMFKRPAVAQGLDNCIRVRLYTDRNVEPDLGNKAIQQSRFDSIELPLYALVAADSRVLGTSSFTRSEADFLAFLRLAAR
jgi:thiol:disulfide interchange protein DsbD